MKVVNKMYQAFSCILFVSFASFSTSVSCRVFYASPSINDLCVSTNNSCLILSEIAEAVSSTNVFPDSNITIIFLPGNHSLGASNFTLTAIPYVSMKSLDRDGSSRYVINCHPSSRFLFRFNSFIHISGLTFRGCFETEIHSVIDLTMEDCRMCGKKEPPGTGLVITNSSVSISQTYFTSFSEIPSHSHKASTIYCSQSSIY